MCDKLNKFILLVMSDRDLSGLTLPKCTPVDVTYLD